MEGAKSFITCPLCSSRYSETGAHIPRMLPCTHTVCGMCIEQEIKRVTCLVCRECGKKHEIPNDGKTFPPNNYILGMLQLFGQQSTPETTTQGQQSQAQIKEREGIEFKQCPEHTRELSLYCKSEGCGKDICQLCMLENHKSHEVVDIKREMTQRLDALTKELAKSKEEMRMIKENLASNFDQSLQQLEERKVLFETMIKESTHCFQNVSKEIDEKMKEIEDQILKVNKMKESGTSLGGVEVAERLLRGKKLIYQYSKYNGVPISECGKLVNEYFSAISHQVTSTFKVPGCDCVHVTSDGCIVLCSDDDNDSSSNSDHESSSRIILYDTEGTVQQEVVVDADVPFNLTDVYLAGQKCLALLYYRERKVVFRSLQNLRTVLKSYSLVSTCSFVVRGLSPSVLLYGHFEKESHSVVSADFYSSSPTVFRTPCSIQQDIRETCFAKLGEKQFLVVTSDEGLSAYDIHTGTKEWQINNQLSGLEKDAILSGVTSDEFGHFFACDENNNCLQIFTIEGVYVGAVFFGQNVGTPRCALYCNKTKNIVIFHDSCGKSNSVTVVNITV